MGSRPLRRGSGGRGGGCPGTLRKVKREGKGIEEYPPAAQRRTLGSEGVLSVLRDPSANAPEPWRRRSRARGPGRPGLVPYALSWSYLRRD